MTSLDGAPQARRRPRVRRVMLNDFRSYPALDLAIRGSLVVLCGENGAGKTNLLEALSLFAPGRGLRRAELAECARVGGTGGFALSIEVEEDGETHQLGSGWKPGANGEAAERRNRIDRAAVASSRAFCDHVRLVWLTPAMDSLFAGPAANGAAFSTASCWRSIPVTARGSPSSSARCADAIGFWKRAGATPQWLDAIEREAAELGVAVAAARLDCVRRLEALIAAERDDSSPFPWAKLALQGEIEAMTGSGPALAAEDRYRASLRDNRGRDAAAGRTLIGPHLSDLLVWHGPKQAPAATSSTGEQKALIVGLALAHARLVAEMSGIAPLALLDEVAAHFDPRRRAALYDALARLGGQVFLTGADPAVFAELEGRAEMFEVSAEAGVRLSDPQPTLSREPEPAPPLASSF